MSQFGVRQGRRVFARGAGLFCPAPRAKTKPDEVSPQTGALPQCLCRRRACKPGSVPACAGGHHSSRTTVTRGLKQPTRKLAGPASNASLFGLAPDGVYRACRVTTTTGGLLPHRFTLTPRLPTRRSAFCGTFRGLLPLGVTQRPALRSPDFPPRAKTRAATARPAFGTGIAVVPQFGVILRQASFFAPVEYRKSTQIRHILWLTPSGRGRIRSPVQFRYPAELSLRKKLAFLV